MASKKPTVKRHNLIVRSTHWAVAISGFLLLFSGFGEMPMYKRYNLIKVPGFGWSQDFELQLVLHYVAAFVFTAAIVFHIIYHLRRKETACIPKKGDMKESAQIIKAMVTGGEEPPSGKFLAEQRLAYAALGIVSLLLVLTGLVKVYKNFNGVVFPPEFMTFITLTHTGSTMLFMLLVIAHLAAFAIKANWPLLPSMFTGRVCAEYANHRHCEWDPECDEETGSAKA